MKHIQGSCTGDMYQERFANMFTTILGGYRVTSVPRDCRYLCYKVSLATEIVNYSIVCSTFSLTVHILRCVEICRPFLVHFLIYYGWFSVYTFS